MAKLIKGYYINGVWHEYGGKLYDTIGYNTNGSMTQKAITENIGELVSLINGYRLAIRVIGDASVSNLDPFYFKSNGESFYIELTYNAGYALNVISIIMDGTDITQEAYQDGVISIDRVTGNVVITVETASVTDTNMFTKRTTGNGISILNNKALLKGIRGNSGIWTQFRPDTLDTSSTGVGYFYKSNNYTLTLDDDGVFTMSNFTIQTSIAYYHFGFWFTRVTDHKYYISCQTYIDTDTDKEYGRFGMGFTSNNNTISGSGHSSARTKNAWINTRAITELLPSGSYCMLATYNASSSVQRWLTENTSIRIKNIRCVDLTKLFGAGNEPTTTAEFERLFPIDNNYDFNRGIVLNNLMTNYISKDSEETTLQNVSLNVPTLTGKLNGEGEGVVVFPDGMKFTQNKYISKCSYLTKNDSKGSYFNIPYIPKGQNIKIKFKLILTSYINNSTANLSWFYAVASGTNAYRICRNGTNNSSALVACGNTDYVQYSPISYNGNYEIELSFGYFTISGKSPFAIGTTIGDENTANIQLLNGINANLYYFQVYDNDVLVVDCQPYRIGTEGVLYESVSDTFIHLTQVNGEGTISCGGLTESEISYDEIKQMDGVWKAYKRVGDTRATNAISNRVEYDSLEQEEVYILDDPTIPTEITVADQGIEEILPANEATPVTVPAIMEIQYGSIPSRGLLGGTKGGGSDENEPQEEEPEEEPIEDTKESPANNEKQELKK